MRRVLIVFGFVLIVAELAHHSIDEASVLERPLEPMGVG